MKSYTFDEKDEFSKNGIKSVCSYLNTLKKTIEIKNVEDDKEYQKNGIDLVWIYRKGKNNVMISIEVKTDKYITGNFWLETLSNERIGTLGCFVKCKARYLFYYFINWKNMYIIPMKKARPWFLENINRFKESKTSTKDINNNHQHITVGRLVPINIMMKEVEGIKLVKEVTKLDKFTSQK